jgi:signal transduction histidine kinase
MTSDDARALALEIRRLAHDLNNALMPILLASSTIRMKSGSADEALVRRIDAIEQSARRASAIVEEMQSAVRRIAPPDTGERAAMHEKDADD